VLTDAERDQLTRWSRRARTAQALARRADAVKAVLVQLGVAAGRIATVGDGSHLPGRVNDRGPHGQLLVGPAILDRKVVAKLTGPKCGTG